VTEVVVAVDVLFDVTGPTEELRVRVSLTDLNALMTPSDAVLLLSVAGAADFPFVVDTATETALLSIVTLVLPLSDCPKIEVDVLSPVEAPPLRVGDPLAGGVAVAAETLVDANSTSRLYRDSP
jgi:hypothetical protein